MNNLHAYTSFYFLGIGGIGMSALARYFNSQGKFVAGYDKTSTPLTDELKSEGIRVHFQDDIQLIPSEIKSSAKNTLVIYTPAVPTDHHELNWLKDNGYSLVKRSVVLGWLSEGNICLAVAGTHGKTTTSSMLAHLLKTAGVNCTAFLGGISVNLDSNLLTGDSSKPGHTIVAEADEFDRSFLTLYPDIAVITSMDPDHLDIYGNENQMGETYRMFASQIKPEGTLLFKKGLNTGKISARSFTYSLEKPADYYADNISVRDGRYNFSLVTPDLRIDNLTLGMPGKHNVENAVAASAVALLSGTDPGKLTEGLSTYKGVKRRFEYHIRRDDLVYIDDYAHHPRELTAAITSVKELYPDKKITGIFQPHLYSRTRDFVDGFAESLSLLDELYLLDIYPARELPIPGITSEIILDKVTIDDKRICTMDEVFHFLRNKRPEVLLTLGAGDIDQMVLPLTRQLSVL